MSRDLVASSVELARTDLLKAFLARHGLTALDVRLLDEATTHSSLIPDPKKGYRPDSQRLEFLGDRVLGLVVARELMRRFPDSDEGGLTARFNVIVSATSCAAAARRMGLGPLLAMGKGGNPDSDTVLGDAAEAFIAAVCEGISFDAARDLVLKYWAEAFDGANIRPKDPKNALQEWAAARGHAAPVYQVLSRSGPDHAPVFTIEVRVGTLPPHLATGTSKRDAEREAARAFLTSLGEVNGL